MRRLSWFVGCLFLLTLPAFTEDVIDVSGSPGTSGSNGTHGSGGSYGGYRGENGRPGGNGTPGSNAGYIDVHVLGGGRGVVRVRGKVQKPGGVVTPVEQSASGVILRANGGNGGNGGRGGDGGTGGPGTTGSDATRYFSGENGGNGGQGGDAGPGGHGRNGGDGGRITVRVNATDTHWLMRVRGEATRGGHGVGGSAGSPGSGGTGGQGGSSMSWTEEIPYTETETFTNPDGTTGTRTVTRYRTEHHSKSGGSNGSSGSSGHSASNGENGKPGKDGEFVIVVTYDGGETRTYRQRYDLQLAGFEIQDDNQDGVFEPGEVVTVRKVTVKNTGGMPTPPPPTSHVEVYLEGDGWILSDRAPLRLPKSLAPGESHTFDGLTLKFRLRDAKQGSEIPALGEPFRARHSVTPSAMLTEVDAPFTSFRNPKEFEIRYPVEIKPVRMLRALRAGESTRVLLEVKNISGQNFGSASDLKREIGILLNGSSENGARFTLTFTDEGGKTVDLQEGFLKSLELLPAGESRVVEGTVTAGDDVDLMEAFTISNTLQLGATAIQQRQMRLVVARGYRKSPDSQVLVVSNAGHTRESLLAWSGALAKLGLKSDFWNLSYYGYLDFAKALEANRFELPKDFAGKTILLLDNPFETELGRQSRALDFLSQESAQQALLEHGIHVVVAGPGSDRIPQIVLPTAVGEILRYDSVDSFQGLIQKKYPDALAPASIDRTEHRILVDKGYWFFSPKEAHLQAAAQALRAWLQRQFPHRRFVVVVDTGKEFVKEGKKYRLGELVVRQTLDRNVNGASGLKLTDAEGLDVGVIGSADVARRLVLGLSFATKLRALDAALATLPETGVAEAGAKAYADGVADALIADLAVEYRIATEGFWRWRPTQRLSNLGLLAAYPFQTSLERTGRARRFSVESVPRWSCSRASTDPSGRTSRFFRSRAGARPGSRRTASFGICGTRATPRTRSSSPTRIAGRWGSRAIG